MMHQGKRIKSYLVERIPETLSLNCYELVKKRLRHVASQSPARKFSAGRFLVSKYCAAFTIEITLSLPVDYFGQCLQTIVGTFTLLLSRETRFERILSRVIIKSLSLSIIRPASTLSPCTRQRHYRFLYYPPSVIPSLDRLLDDTRKHKESSKPRDSRC